MNTNFNKIKEKNGKTEIISLNRENFLRLWNIMYIFFEEISLSFIYVAIVSIQNKICLYFYLQIMQKNENKRFCKIILLLDFIVFAKLLKLKFCLISFF